MLLLYRYITVTVKCLKCKYYTRYSQYYTIVVYRGIPCSIYFKFQSISYEFKLYQKHFYLPFSCYILCYKYICKFLWNIMKFDHPEQIYRRPSTIFDRIGYSSLISLYSMFFFFFKNYRFNRLKNIKYERKLKNILVLEKSNNIIIK